MTRVDDAETDKTGAMLLVDAANVIGSRPTGWWRDRPGAARGLVGQVRAAVGAGRVTAPVVIVLEGRAREGVPAGSAEGVSILHAAGSGDDALVDTISNEAAEITLVTADRELRRRAEALGATVVGPSWLLGLLE